MGDVLGTSQIRPYQSKLLSPVLPYAVNTVMADYQVLPDSMRHYFVVKLYVDTTSRLEDNPYVNLRIPTTRLNGKPLALSFKPSSKADEDLITSYLPKPHADGTPIQPSELPTSLPGYLIHLTPELTLDGQTLATGHSYRMGDKMLMDMGMDSPNSDLPKFVDKTITVGEYHAIGYNLQGMSQQQLQATKAQLEAAKSKLQSQDQTQLASLTKHDITGAILQAGVQSYFAINQTQSEIASRQAGLVDMPYMSFGSFATHFTVVDRYGMPWQVSPKSMMMDIDRYFTLSIDHNNDAAKTIQFRAASGARMSANEHLVPEALFDDPNTPAKEAEGISAVKALKIAMQQGQKIYTITQSNQATVLPLLQHSAAVMQDIQNALAAGKVVTVSADKISYNDWTGSGYILMDQQTGAGAYLIGGGLDGGVVIADALNSNSYYLTLFGTLLSIILTAAFKEIIFFSIPGFGIILTLLTIALGLALTWATYVDMKGRCEGEAFKENTYFVLIFSLLSILGGLISSGGAQILSNLIGTVNGIKGGETCP
mgnify:CR=1 FL=1